MTAAAADGIIDREGADHDQAPDTRIPGPAARRLDDAGGADHHQLHRLQRSDAPLSSSTSANPSGQARRPEALLLMWPLAPTSTGNFVHRADFQSTNAAVARPDLVAGPVFKTGGGR